MLSPLDVVEETNINLANAGGAHLPTGRARAATSRIAIAARGSAALEQLLHGLDPRCELGRRKQDGPIIGRQGEAACLHLAELCRERERERERERSECD